jgi:Helix-turn-helix domain
VKLSRTAVWRDAIRDAELDRTAKLVAFVIGTYMNAAGKAYPSKRLIAEGCALGSGKRAVDQAVDRLEAAGYLRVRRSRGRVSFTYYANVPTSHPDASLFSVNGAPEETQRRTDRRSTSHRGATESAESAECVAAGSLEVAPPNDETESLEQLAANGNVWAARALEVTKDGRA